MIERALSILMHHYGKSRVTLSRLRHRRRSSLQLPESAAASRSQTASNTGYRDRFKETVEKIRQFSVPSTLLRRRAASGLERQMVSDPLPLMRSALTVPFYAIARDENGRKGVPVILEAVHLQFRDDDGEEGTAGKSEQQQHHQQFHIHVTYGEMSWYV